MIALVLYPYVYLSARALFRLQGAAIVEAARTLGAGAGSTFCRIVAADGAPGACRRPDARVCSRRSTISAPANISASAR